MSRCISLGIDLGTSELKAVLLDQQRSVLAQTGIALSVSRPHPGWSEQNPDDWWQACLAAMHRLKVSHPGAYADIRCIGLSGQMHGAVLLDQRDAVIRPAILWDDSRSVSESASLAELFAESLDIIGSVPMAGLTAPKLLWLKTHEPTAFKAIDCVLSPKDYLRLKLTARRITDMSDAAGTCWLNVTQRQWFEPMIEATGLTLQRLPLLVEGTEVAGQVLASVAQQLGLSNPIIVAGGGGDNPVSGVGIGAIDAGHSFISLGTSAAVVSITDRPRGNAATGVHSYCHALPNRWYAMGAILSGASCLRWAARLFSQASEQALLDLIAQSLPAGQPVAANAPLFLPYLSGERTPHNDPLARGAFMNLAHHTTPAVLGYAVLEGVGFALRDAMNSVQSAGATVNGCSLVGGGARSEYWAQLLSNILGRELKTVLDSELGAAIGAAILGFCALGRTADVLGKSLPTLKTFVPDHLHQAALGIRYEAFRELFPAVQRLSRTT